MPTNDFIPFGTDPAANVDSQVTYSSWTRRLSGFISGIVPSTTFNKVLRQGSFIAAMIGQFIVDVSGQDQLDDGNLATALAKFKTAIGSVGRRSTVYSTAGVYTFTVPAGVYVLKATVVGGGGGGSNSNSTTPGTNGSSGGGGAAGGLAIGIYSVTPGAAIAITVGAGGTSQANGGTSSAGTLCSATGGGGSTGTTTSSAGGTGGTASGGNILNVTGGYGSDGLSGAFTGMGNGASGPFGGAGRAAASAGAAGIGPGAGGGGSYNGTASGGAGAPGIVILEY